MPTTGAEGRSGGAQTGPHALRDVLYEVTDEVTDEVTNEGTFSVAAER